MTADGSWRKSAACADDPVLFSSDTRPRLTQFRAAREVCRQCPVVLSCATFAREIRPTWGIWAGEWWAEDGRPELW